MKNTSLIFRSIVVMTVLSLILASALTMISYNRLIAEQKQQMVDMEWTLHNIFKEESDAIENVKNVLKQGTNNLQSHASVKQIQALLNSMKSNQMIHYSYLIMPELAANGDKVKLQLILANKEYYVDTFIPGASFEIDGEYARTFKEMNENGYATSKPYEDKYGNWVSVISEIKNDKNEKIAYFGIDFNYTEIMTNQRNLLIQMSSIGLGIVAVVVLITYFLLRNILRPISVMSKMTLVAAEGDLSVRIPVKSKDEVGRLAANFNQMIESIRLLAQNVKSTSQQVTSSSDALLISAEQTTRATNEIASAIQEVASGSEMQMQASEESKVAMAEMAMGTQRIAESSARLSDYAREVTDDAERGNQVIIHSVSQMELIHTTVSQSVEILDDLNRRSLEIGNIVTIISDISKQTNLLALNAAIEASRVGEHGRGFAVVANEVRKLAELSRDSSEKIGELLSTIVDDVKRVSTAMGTSKDQVETGAKAVNMAGQTFDDIVRSLRSVHEQVEEVSAAAEQMSAGSEQVAASLDELSTIARGASMNSQSVAASSEEQMAMMEEISSSATLLRDTVTHLEQEIGKFRLDGGKSI
ncbi:methyl-accepting chemotaxis protein [Paenibacillus sp. N1-5-1-14]|uniref:methyl-accepting chemotaxis protein n=1 Tax=Paenibacillus radicibacter TaxID=2972488 RepID=UPI0021594B54|nr:HAMP domain-containing methyl-accepting chemotaxis protein [Paenibacillus radicibacter]MCR8644984.1 methyl-accepting chemotaxis protein [Paenibacillus radicibacter]